MEIQVLDQDISGGNKMDLIWNPERDNYFVELMEEQCVLLRKISKIRGGFNKDAWKEMEDQMKSKFGPTFTASELKNRLKSLRKTYHMMKRLHEHNGLGWDHRTKKVTAEEDWWEDYIQAYPEAAAYRTEVLPDYDSLWTIFHVDRSDGRHSISVGGQSRNQHTVAVRNKRQMTTPSSTGHVKRNRHGNGPALATATETNPDATTKNRNKTNHPQIIILE